MKWYAGVREPRQNQPSWRWTQPCG